MTNLSRSISHILFHCHGIICPILLLLLAAPPSATAQMSTNSSSQDIARAHWNFIPSMGTLIVVLVGALFFMGFLSLYIRCCGLDAAGAGNSRQLAAARLRQSKCGLDPEVIDSFPIFQFSEVKDLKISRGGALECAVCLAEFENDDTLRLLPKCDHVFHPECIDAWLASHVTCPVCRANLTQSQNELAQGTESTHTEPTHLSNPVGLSEAQNQIQISIDIDESQNREAPVSEMPKRNRRGGGKFPRSHSTGHSLFQPGENFERYTLRLPVEMRRQMMSRRLKRTISCVIVLPVEGSSRRGEESSRGRQVGRSDRWVFSMTPPFFSRARLPTSPKMDVEGDVTAAV